MQCLTGYLFLAGYAHNFGNQFNHLVDAHLRPNEAASYPTGLSKKSISAEVRHDVNAIIVLGNAWLSMDNQISVGYLVFYTGTALTIYARTREGFHYITLR